MGKYPIFWAPKARITYFEILDYLDHHWGQKVVLEFIQRTEDILDLLSTYPKLFQYSPERKIYRCVLTKQIVLFYRIKQEQVELLLFWDARQKPEKLKI